MAEHRRPYLRDGVPGMTMAQQEAILTAAGVDLASAYRDELTAAARRRREPSALKQRAIMLQPTSRRTPETIVVAGLRVLGWKMEDVCDALAAASRRNATVWAVDIDKRFGLDTDAAELAQAIGDAARATRRAQTAEARALGIQAAQAKRNRLRDAKIAEARKLWALPPGEISGAEIAERLGVTLRTLNNWLGPRGEAREKAARAASRKGKHL